MKEEMLILDLETTGLDPRKDEILEVGAIRVDRDLNVLAERSWVVSPRDLRMHPVVCEMHTKNGLLAELPQSESVGHVQGKLVAFCGSMAGKIRLAGNSVHFDLEFIRSHMPWFAQRLSHRIVDCSTLRDTLRLWRPDVEWFGDGSTHRALADCHNSLQILRRYRTFVLDTSRALHVLG